MYTSSIPTWNHSQKSLAAEEALNWKISCHGIFFKWSRRGFEFVQEKSWAMRWKETSHFEFDGKSMETQTSTW